LMRSLYIESGLIKEVDLAKSRRLVAIMSTGHLKLLWRREDWELDDTIDGILIDHVHEELNCRGEGDSCAR
jgi:hypothetical protein